MTQIAQKSLRDYLQETEDAISKGRIDDAESKCQQILAHFPESLDAQRLLGEVYLAKGALDEAQQAFDWVLTNDPENVVTYCGRALISERLGDYDTALDCYQQAYELSSGNTDNKSKIRQLFNNLSQKAGQQGFMLSRAGLARLYMRGSLLTQAIQEWEAVLSTTPDRLDARTGLLETYWHEGLYERVAQLATQILEDVPGCEKALLLLSYVTSLKSTSQAQDFIRRVEVLDPDLLMAHELFSDLFASQPADQFLDLLKKPPVVLSTLPASNNASISSLEEMLRQSSSTPKSELPTSTWDTLQNWSSSNNDLPYQVTPDMRQDPPALSTWSNSPTLDDLPWSELAAASSGEHSTPYDGPSLPQNRSIQPEEQFPSRSDQQEEANMEHSETQPEPWEALQDALTKVNAEGGSLSSLSPEIWATLDKYLQKNNNTGYEETRIPGREDGPALNQEIPIVAAEPASSGTPSWMSSLHQPSSTQGIDSFNELTSGNWQDEEHLTTSPDINKNSSSSPLTPPNSRSQMNQNEPSSPFASSPASQEIAPSHALPNEGSGLAEPSEDSDNDDEDSLFGPAWLRSLGATGIDDEHGENDDQEKTVPPESSTAQTAGIMPQFDTWSSPQQTEEESSWPAAKNGSSGKEAPDTMRANAAAEEPSWMSSLQPTSQEQEPRSESSWMGSLQPTSQEQEPRSEPSWMSSLQSTPQEQEPRSEPSWLDTLRQSSESSWLSSLQPMGEASWMDALQQGTEAKKEFSPSQNESAPLADEGRYNWSNSFGTVPETDWKSSSPSYTPATNWASAAESSSQSPFQESLQDDPLLATLKELEQGLLAQGFVPLEPNSLSSLAQQQEHLSLSEPPLQASEETMPHRAIEPSLSSALAQLGGYGSQAAIPAKENEQGQIVQDRSAQGVPSWSSTPPASPAPSLPPVAPEIAAPVMREQLSSYASAPEPVEQKRQTQPAPTSAPVGQPAYGTAPAPRFANNAPRASEMQTREEPAANLHFRPTPTPAPTSQAPLVHIDPLLDSELETTMKRPAIRLQPMQQPRSEGAREQGGTPSNTRTRASISRGTEQGMTNQERLVTGYQHQLVGDYDEAMLEYRVIIRSAPTLLNEVISNVRALLKLAPKYAAGYRVLGDAYMRQGEYLQAMEAYNKALTMAKKKA